MDEKDVPLADLDPLLRGRREKVLVIERLPLLQRLLPPVASDVDEDSATDDALLRDGKNAGLRHSSRGGLGGVSVVDLISAPQVPQRVVLAGPLQIHGDHVVGELRVTVRCRAVTVEVHAAVHDVDPLGRSACTGKSRVTLGVSDLDLECEGLSRPDLGGTGKRLLGSEKIERTDFVVVAPAAPVRGLVREKFDDGGNGRSGGRVGHDELL